MALSLQQSNPKKPYVPFNNIINCRPNFMVKTLHIWHAKELIYWVDEYIEMASHILVKIAAEKDEKSSKVIHTNSYCGIFLWIIIFYLSDKASKIGHWDFSFPSQIKANLDSWFFRLFSSLNFISISEIFSKVIFLTSLLDLSLFS